MFSRGVLTEESGSAYEQLREHGHHCTVTIYFALHCIAGRFAYERRFEDLEYILARGSSHGSRRKAGNHGTGNSESGFCRCIVALLVSWESLYHDDDVAPVHFWVRNGRDGGGIASVCLVHLLTFTAMSNYVSFCVVFLERRHGEEEWTAHSNIESDVLSFHCVPRNDISNQGPNDGAVLAARSLRLAVDRCI